MSVQLLCLYFFDKESNDLSMYFRILAYISIFKAFKYNQSLHSHSIFNFSISPLTVCFIISYHLNSDALQISLHFFQISLHHLIETIELNFLQSHKLLYVPEQQFHCCILSRNSLMLSNKGVFILKQSNLQILLSFVLLYKGVKSCVNQKFSCFLLECMFVFIICNRKRVCLLVLTKMVHIQFNF